LIGIPKIGILAAMAASPIDQLPLSVAVYQILLSLVDQDLHGYALIKDIEARTAGEVRLTASTMYGVLARLLEDGLVDEASPAAERRRRYRLTRTGRQLLRKEAGRLARAARWAADKRLVPDWETPS
jgi:DNA-binding PadR family transcriptional regulator